MLPISIIAISRIFGLTSAKLSWLERWSCSVTGSTMESITYWCFSSASSRFGDERRDWAMYSRHSSSSWESSANSRSNSSSSEALKRHLRSRSRSIPPRGWDSAPVPAERVDATPGSGSGAAGNSAASGGQSTAAAATTGTDRTAVRASWGAVSAVCFGTVARSKSR
jgi:hypothetical protein